MKHSANKSTLILCVAVCALLLGCDRAPDGYKNLYSIAPKQRLEEIKKLPAGRQIDIYLYAVSHREPPDLGLAAAFAEQPEVIAEIAARLAETADERDKANLFLALQIVSQAGVELRKDQVLMQKLSTNLNTFSDSVYRQKAASSLKVIIEH